MTTILSFAKGYHMVHTQLMPFFILYSVVATRQVSGRAFACVHRKEERKKNETEQQQIVTMNMYKKYSKLILFVAH